MCLACQVAKARKLPRNTGQVSSVDPSQQQNVLSQNQLVPGQRIFVDQYEFTARGRLSTLRGQEQPLQMYCGGTLFYDAASQLIQVYHQISLGVQTHFAPKICLNEKLFNVGFKYNRIILIMESSQKVNFVMLFFKRDSPNKCQELAHTIRMDQPKMLFILFKI